MCTYPCFSPVTTRPGYLKQTNLKWRGDIFQNLTYWSSEHYATVRRRWWWEGGIRLVFQTRAADNGTVSLLNDKQASPRAQKSLVWGADEWPMNAGCCHNGRARDSLHTQIFFPPTFKSCGQSQTDHIISSWLLFGETVTKRDYYIMGQLQPSRLQYNIFIYIYNESLEHIVLFITVCRRLCSFSIDI